MDEISHTIPTFNQVVAFVCERVGACPESVNENTSLQGDLGVYGDDICSLIAEYGKKFSVDVSGYCWYFHSPEEGFSPGALFFAPPNERVQQIPITLGMLHDFAAQGKWCVEYPKHEPPPRWRPDIIINQAAVLILVGSITFFFLRSIWRAFVGG